MVILINQNHYLSINSKMYIVFSKTTYTTTSMYALCVDITYRWEHDSNQIKGQVCNVIVLDAATYILMNKLLDNDINIHHSLSRYVLSRVYYIVLSTLIKRHQVHRPNLSGWIRSLYHHFKHKLCYSWILLSKWIDVKLIIVSFCS
jgi:hypothetical protein